MCLIFQSLYRFYDQTIQAILRHINFDGKWQLRIAISTR